jgi:cell division protein FtsW (lipid II flippase)
MKAHSGEIIAGRELESFLNEVCGSIRAKEVHADIREELIAHIEELRQARIEQGMSEEEALREAIQAMGDPAAIGSGLDAAHRPKVHWGMLAVVGGMIAVGILAMMNVQAMLGERMPDMAFLERKLVFIAMGLIMMIVLWLFDYRWLKRWSELLHGGSIALMLVLPFIGLQVNGRTMYLAVGSIGIDITTVALVGMIAGLAGMKPLREWTLGRGAGMLAYRLFLPLVLFVLVPVLVNAVIYALVFGSQLWLTRKSNKQLLALLGVCTVPFYAMLTTLLSGPFGEFRLQRLTSFLRIDDPQGSDYSLIQSLEAIRSAGWFGHGYAAWNNTLPYIYSDSWLPYFVYCFGWLAGIGFAALTALFIGMIASTATLVRESFGKRLAAAICVWLSVQYVVPFLMAIGWAPYVGVQLPIVSYSGMHTVLQLAMIGLLLSAYRRRMIIRTRSELQE